jgi:hypothetical protein
MFDWFKARAPSSPAAPPEDDAPPGEAEAVVKIKHICWMAGMSAENIASEKAANIPPEDGGTYEFDRYTKLRAQALRLADTITDEFYRSGAIHFIVDLCMKGGDVDDARALFKQVTVDMIREKIGESYPQLTRPSLSSVIKK